MTSGDKPLVWLEGEIKTPPLSQAARLEAGTFFLSELQADQKGSYTRHAIYRRAKAYSGSTLEPRRLSIDRDPRLSPASVSGIYIAHPESRYFMVGRIGRDQVEDYAARKAMTVEDVERWLAPVLGYTPKTDAVPA